MRSAAVETARRLAETLPGRGLAIRRGVLHIDGEPTFLWSADYPYYRDDPAHWRDRLERLREAGIGIVTSYIPWRHHAPRDPGRGGSFDFEGRSQQNRNVLGFLQLVGKLGMKAIVKPGPFIHAELRYGGLPDYVDPDRDPGIEPERMGTGSRFSWVVSRNHPEANHALPAPLDPRFQEHVRAWLQAVTREVIAPLSHPRGPIIAVQLLNEGIYSDASNGIISNYGYSASSTALWHAFVERKYATLEEYNRLHGTRHEAWTDVPNPSKVPEDPVSRRHLLANLDRSQFTNLLYDEVILRYRHMMLEAGLDAALPMYMNYNPNGETYAKFPGSNDGWYSKVEWHPGENVQWGYTNWIGVVAHSAKAYVQYILAASRERGPNLEEDWGFSHQYDIAYAHAGPSHFQSLLFLANGATGINVYTGVGTKAWRGDDNLRLEAMPWDRGEGEYPGHAPVGSEGQLRHKYWVVQQLGAYLAAEGASMASAPRAASMAWAVYQPYAWAGAWAPRGARDHRPFLRAGFRACPHVTYHGLEGLIETALSTGLDWRQLDLREADEAELDRWPLLLLAGYDYMSPEAQAKLVGHVRRGGHLLVTGLLPRWNDVLERDAMPLRDELFPHGEEEFVKLRRPVPVDLAGGAQGRAQGWAVRVAPPPGAEPVAAIHADTIGYRVRVGTGTATYLGYHPWYASLSGDDTALVEANRAVPAWIAKLTGVRGWWARARGHEGVDVWQYNAPGDVQHLAVVSRAPQPEMVAVEYTRASGEAAAMTLAVLPRTAHLVTVARGEVRSLYLKSVNDHEGLRAPPRLDAAGRRWGADGPCDLLVAARPGGSLEVSAGSVDGGEVEIALGVPRDLVERVEAADGRALPVRAAADGGVRFPAHDVARAGSYRVVLREGNHAWWIPGRPALAEAAPRP